ncbi:hypothetical protein [Parvibaculum sp.]|uniref:hypothetical protein n=1 Tax=Parvibaculum sp. TaxID=2024848 RepID=UPI002B508C2B|nr:hypothetical protein [Parvibaculum sp.]HUD51311.1 hypothetical protein [Parvibaculum sp.]
MFRIAIKTAGAAILATCLFAGAAWADEVTGSGTLVMKDKFNSQTEWGSGLTLPRAGRITRVMDGTYGFAIRDAKGEVVADFLDPQQAVGMKLAAGNYVLDPYVCTRHRHHHVEVTAEY